MLPFRQAFRGRCRAMGAWACVAFLPACGHAAGSYRDGIYREASVEYRVAPPPTSWSPVTTDPSVDLAWVNDAADAAVQVNATCHPSDDVPLAALTNHLLMGFTERTVLTQEVVPFDGREALRTHVTAKLDGVPRELLLVVLKKNGCVYDLVLAAPPGAAFAQVLPGFEQMVRSFATVGGRP